MLSLMFFTVNVFGNYHLVMSMLMLMLNVNVNIVNVNSLMLMFSLMFDGVIRAFPIKLHFYVWHFVNSS